MSSGLSKTGIPYADCRELSVPAPTASVRGRWEVSESALTAEISELAERCGFECWPINQTRRQPRQWVKRGPADLFMCGHGACLWVETKVDRNGQSEAQKEFERLVTKNGDLYWVIRSKAEFLLQGKLMGWWR